MYKYDFHCHTSAVSKCGKSTPEELVQSYYDAGFSGVVFTEHFIHGNTAVDRKLPWDERMKKYFEPFDGAKKLAEKLGFTVFIGIEHAYGSGKEVLVYGNLTPEAFILRPDVETMDIRAFVDFCHQNGWFVAHAHPFRERPYIDMSVEPMIEDLDGIEVYNYFNKPEENIKAIELCEKLGLVPISGSDTHHVDSCGKAGMAFNEKIETPTELLKALFSRKGRLIINGEIV